MNWNKIVSIAKNVKNTVDKKKKLPGKAQSRDVGEYAYLLSRAVIYYNNTIKTVSVKEAPKPTRDTIDKTYKKAQYTYIANELNRFISQKGRLPNYVEYRGTKINIELCIYCFAKIVLFYNDKKRLPNTCLFDSSVFSTKKSKYSTKGGKVCKKLMNIGKCDINNYKDVYKAMSKFTYDYYYNDKQTQAQTISKKKGNCVDLNQVERAALLELYKEDKIQIVRGLVKCNDGKEYGHVWCRIKVSSKWVNIDASAAAKGKALGNVICSKIIEITNVNPSWLISDDAKT